ncbi:molybdopterin-dependent oxidoreductase [Raoultibacter timonensis]|uniref:molybdopterin-dependent oxidoreductase n=1 Tax=Raoultibacter timonensis TaxID=1907662 RepID=UPI0026DCEB64|nr:molybdopterin-dependent oxidoreductase [Raoultibacter timonensis]
MKQFTKKALSIATSTLMLGGMNAGAASMAIAQDAPAQDDGGKALQVEAVEPAGMSVREEVPSVQGKFSFTQGEVSPIDAISKAIGAARHLCNSEFDSQADEATSSVWSVEVNGEVENAFSATAEELAVNGSAEFKMGCSCLGNPVDGAASVNAHVSGITIRSLMEAAQPTADANTIVFSSTDGYEISLPYDYVMQRYSLLVYNVNGELLCNSVGGANQLWLGSTAARYFARDVSSITLESRETPPPAPGSKEAGDTYANVPNISITAGGEML